MHLFYTRFYPHPGIRLSFVACISGPPQRTKNEPQPRFLWKSGSFQARLLGPAHTSFRSRFVIQRAREDLVDEVTTASGSKMNKGRIGCGAETERRMGEGGGEADFRGWFIDGNWRLLIIRCSWDEVSRGFDWSINKRLRAIILDSCAPARIRFASFSPVAGSFSLSGSLTRSNLAIDSSPCF